MVRPSVNDRTFLLITGPPGCGKSTLMRGLVAFHDDWESLRTAQQREENIVIFRKRPFTFALHRVFQLLKLNKTRPLRPLERVLAESRARLTENVLQALIETDPAAVEIIQRFYQSSNPEGLARSRSTIEHDAFKTLTRLAWYRLLAKKAGTTLLCEQDSFWHKLIWLNNPEVFCFVPRPTAVVVLTSEDVTTVLMRREARSAPYDEGRLGHLTHSEKACLLMQEQELWAEFARKLVRLNVPVLSLEAYGEVGTQVRRAATFFDQAVARLKGKS